MQQKEILATSTLLQSPVPTRLFTTCETIALSQTNYINGRNVIEYKFPVYIHSRAHLHFLREDNELLKVI